MTNDPRHLQFNISTDSSCWLLHFAIPVCVRLDEDATECSRLGEMFLIKLVSVLGRARSVVTQGGMAGWRFVKLCRIFLAAEKGPVSSATLASNTSISSHAFQRRACEMQKVSSKQQAFTNPRLIWSCSQEDSDQSSWRVSAGKQSLIPYASRSHRLRCRSQDSTIDHEADCLKTMFIAMNTASAAAPCRSYAV